MRRGTRRSTHFPALAPPSGAAPDGAAIPVLPGNLRTGGRCSSCRLPPAARSPMPKTNFATPDGAQRRSGAAKSVVLRASAVGLGGFRSCPASAFELTHYPRCRTLEDRGDSPLRWRKRVREEARFFTYYFILFLDIPIFIPYMSSCQRPNCARRARGRLFRLLPTSKATIPPSPKGFLCETVSNRKSYPSPASAGEVPERSGGDGGVSARRRSRLAATCVSRHVTPT